MDNHPTSPAIGKRAIHAVLIGIIANSFLCASKILGGVYGNSYALIADGVESALDIFSSLIVLGGLKIALAPPDESHPYGHGKAESLSTVVVGLILLVSALALTVESIREILTPQHAPESFTLAILIAVVAIKDVVSRFVGQVADEVQSTSVQADGWHHRADLFTSAVVFLGISIALMGGPGYEAADAYAALVASAIIAFNGCRMLWAALNEIMDSSAPHTLQEQVRALAKTVEGVMDVEECRVRKSGLGYLVDIHVIVDGNISVREGHDVARAVRRTLSRSSLSVRDALVHIEPFERV